MINGFDYKVVTPTDNIATPSMAFGDILYVSRSGIGVRYRKDVTVPEIVPVLKYERILKPDGLLPTAGFYMYQAWEVISGYRQQKFKIGSTVPVGAVYSTSVYGVTAFYTANVGDDANDVANSLAHAINVSTYPAAVTAAWDTADGFLVQIDNGAYSMSIYYYKPSDMYYQNGYYTKFLPINGVNEEYLIYSSAQNSTFATLPALAGSYVFDASKVLHSGLTASLFHAGYSEFSYSETSAGIKTISNVPTTLVIQPNECAFRDNKLYFPTVLGVGEVIEMLYN